MKKRSKIILLIICLIAVFIAVDCLLYFGFGHITWPFSIFVDQEYKNHTQEAKFLREEYPTDIVVYGDAFSNIGKLPIRTVNQLSQEALGHDNSFFYKALVISDREDKLSLSDEELSQIDAFIQDGWFIYYCGKKYLSYFYDKYAEGYAVKPDDKSLGFGLTPIGPGSIGGFWNDSDEATEYFGTQAYEDAFRNSVLSAIKSEIRFWSKFAENGNSTP